MISRFCKANLIIMGVGLVVACGIIGIFAGRKYREGKKSESEKTHC